MLIYVIQNKINDKLYVGKTTKTLLKRWGRHLTDSKRVRSRFYNAIRKYGGENFKPYVLESCVSMSRLDERERYWIEILEPEYNMTKGGTGGWIHDQTGKHWKIKDTSRMKKKKTITAARLAAYDRIRGAGNYQSEYRIFTPWGVFDTWLSATDEAKRVRLKRKDVVTNILTLQKYCLNNIQLNKEGRRTYKEWRGKYTRDIGFFVEKK
jgi:hypothetical protein